MNEAIPTDSESISMLFMMEFPISLLSMPRLAKTLLLLVSTYSKSVPANRVAPLLEFTITALGCSDTSIHPAASIAFRDLCRDKIDASIALEPLLGLLQQVPVGELLDAVVEGVACVGWKRDAGEIALGSVIDRAEREGGVGLLKSCHRGFAYAKTSGVIVILDEEDDGFVSADSEIGKRVWGVLGRACRDDEQTMIVSF